ncbi:glycine zipper 2TM domain-containing protein [Novosphingobium sp.]|uniref:glycine zipper 2TM domain-containing protein n=1 Tax=Novosphingobium sp. TaxID=1874826 RepID=UPI0033401AD6
MKRSILAAVAIAGSVLPGTADARRYRHYVSQRDDHGRCLRFNKTTGTVAGAVGGGVLGNVLFGGTGGTLAGAAVGGLAGHELAHNRRKRC